MSKNNNSISSINDDSAQLVNSNEQANRNNKSKNKNLFIKIYEFMFSENFRNLTKAKKLAYLGIFTAFSVILNFVSIDFGAGGSNKISFLQSFSFIVGAVFGPLGAFIVLFLGDALGVLLKGDTYIVLIGLGTGLLGFINGVVCNVHKNNEKYFLLRVLISFVLCYIICTALINSYGNYIYVKAAVWGGVAKKSFYVYTIARLIPQSIVSALNLGLAIILSYALDDVKSLKLNITGINSLKNATSVKQ